MEDSTGDRGPSVISLVPMAVSDASVGRGNIRLGTQGYGRQTVSVRSSKSVALPLFCTLLEACNPATPVVLLITLPSFNTCHADYRIARVLIDVNQTNHHSTADFCYDAGIEYSASSVGSGEYDMVVATYSFLS